MPVYLDTRGEAVLSIAICDRCSRKFPYGALYSDPNSPGLRVCEQDLDVLDPWRLAARQTENITLRFPRPDVSVAIPGKGKPIPNAPNIASLNEGPNMVGTGFGAAFTPAEYGSDEPESGDIKKT
jgi:hypothetical protein